MRNLTSIFILLSVVCNAQTIQVEKLHRKNNTDSVFKITAFNGDTTWVFCYLNVPAVTLIPFILGGITTAAPMPATTGTMTVNMTSTVITLTPTGNCTINATGGVVGQRVTFIITTAGTTSFTLTFGTGFRKTGTLATGTTAARFFAISWICIGTNSWQEIARTAAQT